MKRYGTISYLNNDKTFGKAIPLQEEQTDPNITFFAGFLADMIRKEIEKENHDEKENKNKSDIGDTVPVSGCARDRYARSVSQEYPGI